MSIAETIEINCGRDSTPFSSSAVMAERHEPLLLLMNTAGNSVDGGMPVPFS